MSLAEAFLAVLQPLPFWVLSLGVLLGIIVGALPGITGGMLMALALPFTYYMTDANAITLLIGMYVGGISGGLNGDLHHQIRIVSDKSKSSIRTINRVGDRGGVVLPEHALTRRIDVAATHENANNCRTSIGNSVVVDAAIGGHDHAITKEDIGGMT